MMLDRLAKQNVRNRFLCSMFLKTSNRDKVLAREIFAELPVTGWNKKVIKGLFRYLFA